MFRHGSLFSGIGGFDIAATWVGWQNIFSSEKNPFCKTILQYYWPNIYHYDDIFQFDAAQFRGCVDIISGGFPCQPFSQAGRRKGKADDRYLFPEACRIITEARPKWIVLENVAGLFSILEPDSLSEMEIKAVELFCENSNQHADSTIIRLQRRVIASIISEINSAGYVLPQLKDGTPIVLCIPAAALNAPHQRDRIWFVAHAHSNRDQQQQGNTFRSFAGQAARRPQERQRQRRGQVSLTDFLIYYTLKAQAIPNQQNQENMPFSILHRLIRILPTAEQTGNTKFPAGKHGQLNPRFVAEMMGFPPNWTELPFLRGEQKV